MRARVPFPARGNRRRTAPSPALDRATRRIDDYGFLGDGIGVALVSTAGSIDWACLRRIDAGSAFGRLLDWDTAGYCRVAPLEEDVAVTRRYVPDTMVLETTFRPPGGVVRLLDLLALRSDGYPQRRLLRLLEGVEGEVEVGVVVSARYDYGQLRPWIRDAGDGRHTLVGGDDGLLAWSDMPLATVDRSDLAGSAVVAAGQRRYLLLDQQAPHLLDDPPDAPTAADLDRMVEDTVTGWRQIREAADAPDELRRSALVLRALGNADTGAIAAAATTSLPEVVGGESNWDYRFTWIRDSWMAVRSLAELGDVDCADRFRLFVERSAAGQVDELQIAFGVGGEHDLFERTLDHLEGWRGCAPVRIGNLAADQLQLDAYGELLELAWIWHERGRAPDPDWWRFLGDVVDHTVQPLARAGPRHLGDPRRDPPLRPLQGLRLGRPRPRRPPGRGHRPGTTRGSRGWRAEADACRAEILERGVDSTGTSSSAFDGPEHGRRPPACSRRWASSTWEDPLMVATVDAVLERLVEDGFVRRHEGWDEEGAFLPCSFWLAECLAHQGRARGGAGVLRPGGGHGQRRRPLRRGVGRGARASRARQLPPGAHPPRPHHGRAGAPGGAGRA